MKVKDLNPILKKYINENKKLLTEIAPLAIGVAAVKLYSSLMLFDEAVDLTGVAVGQVLCDLGQEGACGYNPRTSDLFYNPDGPDKDSTDYVDLEFPPPGDWRWGGDNSGEASANVNMLGKNFVSVASGALGISPAEYVKELNKHLCEPTPIQREGVGIIFRDHWTNADAIRYHFHDKFKTGEGRTRGENLKARMVWNYWIRDNRHPWLRFNYHGGDLDTGRLSIDEKGLAYTIMRHQMFYILRGASIQKMFDGLNTLKNSEDPRDQEKYSSGLRKAFVRYSGGRNITLSKRYQDAVAAMANEEFPMGWISVSRKGVRAPGSAEIFKGRRAMAAFKGKYPFLKWVPPADKPEGADPKKVQLAGPLVTIDEDEGEYWDVKEDWEHERDGTRPFEVFPGADANVGGGRAEFAGKGIQKELDLLFKGADFRHPAGFDSIHHDMKHDWKTTVDEYWKLVQKRLGKLPATLNNSMQSAPSISATGSERKAYSWTKLQGKRNSYTGFANKSLVEEVYGGGDQECIERYNAGTGAPCNILSYLAVLEDNVSRIECKYRLGAEDRGCQEAYPEIYPPSHIKPARSNRSGDAVPEEPIEPVPDPSDSSEPHEFIDVSASSGDDTPKTAGRVARSVQSMQKKASTHPLSYAFRAFVPFQGPGGAWLKHKRRLPSQDSEDLDYWYLPSDKGVPPDKRNLTRNPRRQDFSGSRHIDRTAIRRRKAKTKALMKKWRRKRRQARLRKSPQRRRSTWPGSQSQSTQHRQLEHINNDHDSLLLEKDNSRNQRRLQQLASGQRDNQDKIATREEKSNLREEILEQVFDRKARRAAHRIYTVLIRNEWVNNPELPDMYNNPVQPGHDPKARLTKMREKILPKGYLNRSGEFKIDPDQLLADAKHIKKQRLNLSGHIQRDLGWVEHWADPETWKDPVKDMTPEEKEEYLKSLMVEQEEKSDTIADRYKRNTSGGFKPVKDTWKVGSRLDRKATEAEEKKNRSGWKPKDTYEVIFTGNIIFPSSEEVEKPGSAKLKKIGLVSSDFIIFKGPRWFQGVGVPSQEIEAKPGGEELFVALGHLDAVHGRKLGLHYSVHSLGSTRFSPEKMGQKRNIDGKWRGTLGSNGTIVPLASNTTSSSFERLKIPLRKLIYSSFKKKSKTREKIDTDTLPKIRNIKLVDNKKISFEGDFIGEAHNGRVTRSESKKVISNRVKFKAILDPPMTDGTKIGASVEAKDSIISKWHYQQIKRGSNTWVELHVFYKKPVHPGELISPWGSIARGDVKTWKKVKSQNVQFEWTFPQRSQGEAKVTRRAGPKPKVFGKDPIGNYMPHTIGTRGFLVGREIPNGDRPMIPLYSPAGAGIGWLDDGSPDGGDFWPISGRLPDKITIPYDDNNPNHQRFRKLKGPKVRTNREEDQNTRHEYLPAEKKRSAGDEKREASPEKTVVRSVSSSWSSKASDAALGAMRSGKKQNYSLIRLKRIQRDLIDPPSVPKLEEIQGNLFRFYKKGGELTFASKKSLRKEQKKVLRKLGDNKYGKETKEAIEGLQEFLIARGFLEPQKTGEFEGYTNRDGLYGPNTHKAWLKARRHGAFDEERLNSISETIKKTLISLLTTLRASPQNNLQKGWADWMLNRLSPEAKKAKKDKKKAEDKPKNKSAAGEGVIKKGPEVRKVAEKKLHKAAAAGKINLEKGPNNIDWPTWIRIQHAGDVDPETGERRSNLFLDTKKGILITPRPTQPLVDAYLRRLELEKEKRKPTEIKPMGVMEGWSSDGSKIDTNMGFKVTKWSAPAGLTGLAITDVYIPIDFLNQETIQRVGVPLSRGRPWSNKNLPIYKADGTGIGWLLGGKSPKFRKIGGKLPKKATFKSPAAENARKMPKNAQIFENYFKKAKVN